MYLSRFGVKNYKCLGEIDIPLTPVHVLIGENDSGKTSLLEAMDAFFASSEKPLAGIFPQPWSGRELVRHSSPQPRIDLWGEWDALGEDEQMPSSARLGYGVSLDFAAPAPHCSIVEKWIETNGRKHQFRGASLSSDDQKAVAEVLRPAQKYALQTKLMVVPASIDPIRKFRMDPDGFGLATLLDDILSFDPGTFIALRDEFCKFFAQFRSVRLESEKATARHYQSDGMHQYSPTIGKGIYFETRTGQTIRARHASDGAILFLGLLALSHVPNPPNLLLLEEPENGVYPKRLGQVIKLLKGLVGSTSRVRFPQIILTTHSPYVLSFFEPEEVTLLSRSPDGPDAPVRARPLRDAPHIKERMAEEAFYLGELWYNLSEKELFGDA